MASTTKVHPLRFFNDLLLVDSVALDDVSLLLSAIIFNRYFLDLFFFSLQSYSTNT